MVLPDHKVAITKTVQTLLSVIIQNEGRKYALQSKDSYHL